MAENMESTLHKVMDSQSRANRFSKSCHKAELAYLHDSPRIRASQTLITSY